MARKDDIYLTDQMCKDNRAGLDNNSQARLNGDKEVAAGEMSKDTGPGLENGQVKLSEVARLGNSLADEMGKDTRAGMDSSHAMLSDGDEVPELCSTCGADERCRDDSNDEAKLDNNSKADEMNKDTGAGLDNIHARLSDGSTRPELEWDEVTGEKCCTDCEELMRDKLREDCDECGESIAEEDLEMCLLGLDVVVLFPAMKGNNSGRILRETAVKTTSLKETSRKSGSSSHGGVSREGWSQG